MTRKLFPLILPALLVVPAITAFGGWAVVTVDDLPDYMVAGQPVTFSYRVRQHGVTLLSGLRGRVEAEGGPLEARATATPAREAGRYTATLTLPQPGEWTITIHSGFGNSKVKLEPVRAVNPGAPQRPLPEAERGRRLFAAKGCVTCHSGGAIGPDLAGRRYPPEYLTQFLADPARTRPQGSGTLRMPNLDLKQPEIAALVAFINTERQALR